MSNIVSQAKEITETYRKYHLYLRLQCLSIPANMPNRFRIYIVSPIWTAAIPLVLLEPLSRWQGKDQVTEKNIVGISIVPRIWRPACTAASASAFSARSHHPRTRAHGYQRVSRISLKKHVRRRFSGYSKGYARVRMGRSDRAHMQRALFLISAF